MNCNELIAQSTMTIDPLLFREIILNVRQPIVVRQYKHNWKCFQVSLKEWCRELDVLPMEFEVMSRKCGVTQQWERERLLKKMTSEQFFKIQSGDTWAALNYKRQYEIPDKCKEGIDLSCFGFPEAVDDYSFWLSTKNANTPCHYDTYGCNVVVQIYGKKSWLLFAPDAPLTKSRIPYEESSVYCLENFYAPQKEKIGYLEKLHEYGYICTLEPNDVLIVPRHWWHFVETIETSLSINYWVPLKMDVESQLEECIVKFLMESIVKGSNDPAIMKYLLNPNQIQEIADDSEILSILEHLVSSVNGERQPCTSKTQFKGFSYQYLEDKDEKHLKRKILNAYDVPKVTKSDLKNLLLRNSQRFDENCNEVTNSPVNVIKETLINSICHPSVVQNIKNVFMTIYQKRCVPNK